LILRGEAAFARGVDDQEHLTFKSLQRNILAGERSGGEVVNAGHLCFSFNPNSRVSPCRPPLEKGRSLCSPGDAKHRPVRSKAGGIFSPQPPSPVADPHPGPPPFRGRKECGAANPPDRSAMAGRRRLRSLLPRAG